MSQQLTSRAKMDGGKQRCAFSVRCQKKQTGSAMRSVSSCVWLYHQRERVGVSRFSEAVQGK